MPDVVTLIMLFVIPFDQTIVPLQLLLVSNTLPPEQNVVCPLAAMLGIVVGFSVN